MKKWFVIIGIIAVIAAAGLILHSAGRRYLAKSGRALVEILSIRRGRDLDPSGMIPDRAGFYIRGRGIGRVWDELTGSDFFRELISSSPWKTAGIEDKLSAFRNDFKDRNGFEINRSRIMELGGEDIALSLLPPEDGWPGAVLIISRVGVKARLVEILARWGDGWRAGGDQFLDEEEYRGERIVLFSPTDSFPFSGAYTFVENHLALALAPGPALPVIRQVIDLAQARGEDRSLENSPEFSLSCRAAELPSESFLEWYFQPSLFRHGGGGYEIASSLSDSGLLSMIEWGKEIINNLSEVRSAAGRITFDRGIRSRVSLVFKDKIAGEKSSRPVGIFRSYVPASALLYAAFGLEPYLRWEDVASVLNHWDRQGYRAPLRGLLSWEKESGLSVRGDIIPLLDGRFALVGEEISGRKFLPLPPAAVIIRVVDRERAEEVMERVEAWAARAHGLIPIKEEYGGAEMTMLPVLFFLQPGYVMMDDDLIIGSDRELLKKLIDQKNGEGAGIETDRYYREITAVIEPGRGDFIYLNGERFFQSLLNLGEWYMDYQKIAPDEPRFPEVLYRDTVIPLLNLCNIFRAAGFRATRDKNIVKQDCFLYIP